MTQPGPDRQGTEIVELSTVHEENCFGMEDVNK